MSYNGRGEARDARLTSILLDTQTLSDRVATVLGRSSTTLRGRTHLHETCVEIMSVDPGRCEENDERGMEKREGEGLTWEDVVKEGGAEGGRGRKAW
jgi:hypothetical protein